LQAYPSKQQPYKISALSVLSVDKKMGCGRQPTPSPFEHFVVKKEKEKSLCAPCDWLFSKKRVYFVLCHAVCFGTCAAGRL